jgi:hypothetical protein
MSDKYLVIEHEGKESIFVFPKAVDHDRMAEALEAIRFGGSRDWVRKYKQGQVISAGFVVGGKCEGKSETLNLKSRPDADTVLLKAAIGIHQGK